MSLLMSLLSGSAGFLIVCVVLPSCMMNFGDFIAYISRNIVKFYCL